MFRVSLCSIVFALSAVLALGVVSGTSAATQPQKTKVNVLKKITPPKAEASTPVPKAKAPVPVSKKVAPKKVTPVKPASKVAPPKAAVKKVTPPKSAKSPKLVQGACGKSLNSCTSGVLRDIADASTSYRWSCLGSHGGTTAACNQVKRTASSSNALDRIEAAIRAKLKK